MPHLKQASSLNMRMSLLRDTFVVRSLKRGEGIEHVLRKIGLRGSTWEDAKEKYLKLAMGGI